VSDVFSARAPFVESLSLTLGAFDGTRREDDIGGKSTASFFLAGLAVASSLTPKSIAVHVHNRRGEPNLQDWISSNFISDISAKTRSVISNHFAISLGSE
jgi:hypothetical protein